MNIDSFDFNQFANSLQKARSYASNFKYKCCCPDCNEIAIKWKEFFDAHEGT